LEAIVEPVFKEHSDFIVDRADKLVHPGLIDAQIIHKLLTAEIVVADLTGLNPNVFYEIGIRHMAQKPIIHMHEVGEKIPFDVSLYRSLAYSRLRPKDLTQAQAGLREMVDRALAPDYAVENPVTNARGRFKLEEQATPEQRVVMEQFRAVEDRLMRIETLAGLVQPSTPPALDPPDDYISFFSKGDSVEHRKWGVGTVVGTDRNRITVTFPSVGRKRILDDFLTPARRRKPNEMDDDIPF
jgi:hypothetical protein